MRRLFGLRRVGGALPGGEGFAAWAGRCRAGWALPGLRGGAGFAFELAAPKKA